MTHNSWQDPRILCRHLFCLFRETEVPGTSDGPTRPVICYLHYYFTYYPSSTIFSFVSSFLVVLTSFSTTLNVKVRPTNPIRSDSVTENSFPNILYSLSRCIPRFHSLKNRFQCRPGYGITSLNGPDYFLVVSLVILALPHSVSPPSSRIVRLRTSGIALKHKISLTLLFVYSLYYTV